MPSTKPLDRDAKDPRAASTPTVLLLDPDAQSMAVVEQSLSEGGFAVIRGEEQMQSVERLIQRGVDVIVVDEGLAEKSGLLEQLEPLSEPPAVVLLSAFGTVEGAVEAMRRGASHYAAKPIEPEEILLAVRKAARERSLAIENRAMRNELDRRSSFGSLVVRDPRMREIFSLLETVSQTRATVLLLGESGTGKSVLARAVHAASPRTKGPFVEVNCGALPDTLLESELFGHAKGAFTGALRDRPGRFEAAHGGTIFLDEIGTASPSLQVRLLRVLQDRLVERVGEQRSRPVDVRVVLATNVNLEAEVKAGRFREDLYYRIHVVAIEIPPLRERPTDIPELASAFLTRASSSLGRKVTNLSPKALEVLLRHRWPGNVRELENAMEHAVAVGGSETIEPEDLPAELRGPKPAEPGAISAPGTPTLDSIPLGELDQMLAVCERRFLERALAHSGQCRTRAAKLLGLHRATLYQRMHRVGLDPTARP